MRLGRGVKNIIKLVFINFCWTGAVFAEESFNKPWTFRFSAGNPAPSFVGAGIGYHLQERWEWLGSMGVGWYGDLNIQSFASSMRFDLLPTQISPILGGGFSYLKLNGKGKIQGLDSSAFLGFLTGGLNLNLNSVRITAGIHCHFPLRLNFPFVDFGFIF